MRRKPAVTVVIVVAMVLSSTIAFVAVVPQPAAAQSWDIEVVNDDDRGEGAVALALDEDGDPHVVYFADGDLMHSGFDGRGWSRETIAAGSASDRVGTLDYAIDRGDAGRVSFYDEEAEILRYAVFNGRFWDVSTVDDGNGEVAGQQNSLAIEDSGRPHIAYFGQGGAKYVASSRTGWRGTWVQPDLGVTKFGYGGISNDVASDGTPHVTYYNSRNNELEYARWNGRSWVHEEIDSGTIAGVYVDMVLDEDDNAHLVYTALENLPDGDRRYWLNYARWTGSGWDISTIDSEGGHFPSIALDADGDPHVSYRLSGGLSADELRYARFEDGEWTSERVDTGQTIFDTSIAVDGDGAVHIGYVDYDEINHATRLDFSVPIGLCVVCHSGIGSWLAGDEDVMVHVTPPDDVGNESYYFLSLEDGEVAEFERVGSPGERDHTLNVHTDGRTAFDIATADDDDRLPAVQSAYNDERIEVEPVGIGNRVKYGVVGVSVRIYSFSRSVVDRVTGVF